VQVNAPGHLRRTACFEALLSHRSPPDSLLELRRHRADLRRPDEHGCTLLHVGCVWARPAVLRILRSTRELDEDLRDMVKLRDRQGRTPLHYAAMGGRPSGSAFTLIPSSDEHLRALKDILAKRAPLPPPRRGDDVDLELELIRALLDLAGVPALFVCDKLDLTPLHYAVASNTPLPGFLNLVPPCEIPGGSLWPMPVSMMAAFWGNLEGLDKLHYLGYGPHPSSSEAWAMFETAHDMLLNRVSRGL
jgi:ankyrin repeat protein